MFEPLRLDPELVEPLTAYLAARTRRAVGDAAGRRADGQALAAMLPHGPDALLTRHEVGPAVASDGAEVPLTLFRREGSTSKSVQVFFHGGGMIAGSVATALPAIVRYVLASGVPVVAPEYRLAPENPFPAALLDCFAALEWVSAHARELGADPQRIIVGGDSAGGGLAAAVALLARERGGPAIAAQVLGCPMLDDRNILAPSDPSPWMTWNHDDNATGWWAYLGDAFGTSEVLHLAAPARAADLGGLPRAWVDTGGHDIFCAEDVAYAERLWHAGVPCELRVYADVPHGFMGLNPDSGVARRALADRAAFLCSI